MKRLASSWTKIAAFFAFLHLLTFEQIALSQLTQNHKSRDGRPSPLTYSIRVRQGSPNVEIDASITNHGDQTIKVCWLPNGANHFFEIIHKPTNTPITVKSSVPGTIPFAVDRNDFWTIAPGSTIHRQSILSQWQGQKAFFNKPGTYLVNATCRIQTIRERDFVTGDITTVDHAWSGELHAEPIEVEIGESPNKSTLPKPITGKVVAFDGHPVENAIVEIFYANPSGPEQRVVKGEWDMTQTDRQGKFEFIDVPDGYDFQLIARDKNQLCVSEPVSNADAVSGKSTTLQLPSGIALSGQVIDTHGRPLADVRVSAESGSITYTDVAGRFAISVPDKDHANGHRLVFWQLGRMENISLVSQSEGTSGNWTVEMELQSATAVVGRAIFESGSPVSNARLEVTLVNAESDKARQNVKTQITCMTDRDGVFRMSLPTRDPFQASFHASIEGEPGARQSWTCEVPKLMVGGEPVRIIFNNQGSIVLGVFSIPDLPSSTQVQLRLTSIQTNQCVKSQTIPLLAFDRLYTFEGLAPGEYEIDVLLLNSGVGRQSTRVVVPDYEPFSVSAKIKF